MSWIQLYNSELFDFSVHPVDVSSISIETVAHSLANQCRFNGHTNEFYSVAEHSLWVCMCAELYCLENDVVNSAGEVCLFALLHDASEAVICDIPRPMKCMDEFAWYKEIEREVQEALLIKFVGYTPGKTVESIVKHADNLMLSTEGDQLLSEHPREWCVLPKPLKGKLECISPKRAKDRFLNRYFKFF